MNRQQIFDKVCNHLVVKQCARAYSEENLSCQYRTDDDKMCALGCLIPKKDYKKSFEADGPIDDNLLVQDYFKNNGINVKKNLRFLKDLQRAHDNADEDFMSEVVHNLRQIAREYHLRQPSCIKNV